MALSIILVVLSIAINVKCDEYWEGEELMELEKMHIPLLIFNHTSAETDGNIYIGPMNLPYFSSCLSGKDGIECSERYDCVFERNCCSYNLNNSWPEILHYKQSSKCFNVVYDSNNADKQSKFELIFRNYLVRSGCNNRTNIPHDWILNCEHPETLYSIENFQFVYAKYENDLFRNKFCAFCNNIFEFQPIKFHKSCSDIQKTYISNENIPANSRKAMFFENCNDIITKHILNESLFEYMENGPMPILRQCALPNYVTGKIKKTSRNSNFSYDFLNWMCDIADGKECKKIKNVYCAYMQHFECKLCFTQRGIDIYNDGLVPSFSMFIDFQNNVEAKRQLIRQLCNANGTVSVLEGIEYCLKEVCDPGFVYHKQFDLCIRPATDVMLEIIYTNSTEVLDYTFLNAQCFTLTSRNCTNSNSTNINSIDYGIDSSGLYFGMYTVNFLFSDDSQSDLFFKVLRNTTHLYLQSTKLNAIIKIKILFDTSLSGITKHFDFETTSTSSIVDFTKQLDENINIKNTENVLRRVNCPVEIYNIITKFLNDSTIIEAFSQANDKSEIILWKDLLFVSKCTTSMISLEDQISSWINRIVIPISCIALMITIGVYSRFSELRSLPGICTLHLVNVLLLNYLIFFILSLIGRSRLGDHVCKGGAIINHWAVLCTFTWSLCLSYSSKAAFASSKLSQTTFSWSSILKLCSLAYCPPTLLVIVFIGLDSSTESTIGYLNGNLCWLKAGNSILFGMTIPALSLVGLTVIFYIWTVIGFYKTLKQVAVATGNQSQNKMTLLVILKLGILLGVAWTLPAVNIWIRSTSFDVFTNFLIAVQGFLIALAFLCNQRVATLLKVNITRSKSTTSETKSSNVN